MRKDDDFDDLLLYEAGLDEDGFDYWVLFGDKERRERAEREARKARKQRRRVKRKQPKKELSPGAAIFFLLLAIFLIIGAGVR